MAVLHFGYMDPNAGPKLRLESSRPQPTRPLGAHNGRPGPQEPSATRGHLDNAEGGIVVVPVTLGMEAYQATIASVVASGPTRLVLAGPFSLAAIPEGDNWEQVGADVVLLDCHTVRGSTMLRAVFRVRESGWTGPVLLVLDATTVIYADKAMTLGATDFVLATAPLAEIESRVVRIARMSRHHAAITAVQLPGGSQVTVDWRTREIACDDVRVVLPNREMQLLGVFIDSIGHTLSAPELGYRAWGKEVDPDTSVAPYVSSLRRRLAWFGDRFGIRTIKKAGYRFEISETRDSARTQPGLDRLMVDE